VADPERVDAQLQAVVGLEMGLEKEHPRSQVHTAMEVARPRYLDSPMISPNVRSDPVLGGVATEAPAVPFYISYSTS
jgi:hypothetical protein